MSLVDTRILRVLFEFRSTMIIGNSSQVSGNAFRHAISRQVNVSNGIFSDHQGLKYPRNYEEFFEIRTQRAKIFPQKHIYYSKIEKKEKICYFFLPNTISFDLIDPPEDIIDHVKDKFIQFGPGRNRGNGIVRLIDYKWINLEDIELPEEFTHIILLSPIFDIPKFVHSYKCRREMIAIWNHGKKNMMKIVSPGQFFRMKPIKIRKNVPIRGILRKTLFGKFGFGEFQVYNWKKEDSSVNN